MKDIKQQLLDEGYTCIDMAVGERLSKRQDNYKITVQLHRSIDMVMVSVHETKLNLKIDEAESLYTLELMGRCKHKWLKETIERLKKEIMKKGE